VKKNKEGNDSVKITWPKFKLGEEVVRGVAVPPTYGIAYFYKRQ